MECDEMSKTNNHSKCSFCGTEIGEELNSMVGIDATICGNCIDIYYHIMGIDEEINNEIERRKPFKLPKTNPREIYEKLSEVVVGQENAKKVLAVALYNHYKKIHHRKAKLEKSNILMIGPTGSGKTLLAKTMAEIIKVPFAICDATVYTEAGYVGEDVENILLRLLQNADYDKARAEKGIVFIDEIDKLSRKGENVSITRDVSGEGVQNSLLKILEGGIINVPPQGGRKHPYQEYITFDTSEVLFICAGAFEGLDIHTKATQVGLISGKKENADLSTKQLIKYGITPELLGRLPVIVKLEQLSLTDLKDILTKPQNAILKQYQELLKLDDIDLTFTAAALDTIAHLAMNDHNGARSLRRIIENIMLDVMFDIDKYNHNGQVVITEKMINNNIYNNYQKEKI